LAVALEVVAGAEEGEDTAWRLTLPPARHRRLAQYRIAVLPQPNWLPLDPEISDALHGLAESLRRVGAQVQEAQPEGFGDLREHTATYLSLLWSTAPLIAPPELVEKLLQILRPQGDDFATAARRGLTATAPEYFALRVRREQYRAAYRSFFRGYDVLLSPIAMAPAFHHQPMAWPPLVTHMARTLDVAGTAVPYEWGYVYPGIATLSGHPATAFPVGQTRSSLPIGLQVIGPYLEDNTSIEFAALLEREFGGFRAPPRYADDA
jgi:amidase